MVNSVSGVNSATSSSAAAAVSSTADVEKTKKQDEEKAKKAEKTDKTEKKEDKTTERSSYAFDRITIQNKVKEYIENLKKTHDYPIVQSQLTKYLDLFKVDDFMKKYPNIKTDSEFRTIMYNETIKYL